MIILQYYPEATSGIRLILFGFILGHRISSNEYCEAGCYLLVTTVSAHE